MKDTKVFVISITALLIGFFVGLQSANHTQQNSANQVLDRYPIELSRAGMHRHDLRNVPAENAPEIELSVTEDKMMPGQFQLFINTSNFEFAPESVSEDYVQGEGHAHVFVDDVKISRAYGPWYHLPKLKPGTHEIKVTLNTNNHQEYAVDGEPVRATTTVTVTNEGGMQMN
jgi:hypothetical protein